MSKIYTRTGDQGQTSLVGGRRVLKSDLRVEAYGTVDELGAHIALLNEMLQGRPLEPVQRALFDVQTLLAGGPLADTLEMDTRVLEQAIDNMQAQLPELTSFVLPGGTQTAAQCHVCRTVCRRAERAIVRLAQEEPVEENCLAYINRLSDYLFVLARHLVVGAGKEEQLWKK